MILVKDNRTDIVIGIFRNQYDVSDILGISYSYLRKIPYENDKKLVYSIYKDLKDVNISIEIKKGYNKLCKKIKI